MIIHIYNFIFLLILSFLKRNQRKIVISYLIFLSILDGIRYNCYFDYGSYKEHFFYLGNWKFEKGYEIFVSFFRIFHSYNFMLFIISILVYYFIFYKNYKMLEYNFLFIYIAFTQIVPALGINRQLLSMIFLSIGISFLLKNNIKYFLLLCALGSLFHVTVLIAVPIGIFYYYLCNFISKNYIKIITISIFITHIFIFYDVNNILNFIINFNSFFYKYTCYFENNEIYKVGIFQYLIRNFEVIFPIFCVIAEKKEKQNNDFSLNNRILNVSLIGVLIYYFIYFTFYGKFQIFVGRFGLTLRGLFFPLYYASCYNLLQNKKLKKFFLIVCLFVFAVLFFKQIYGIENKQYIYKTIFSTKII